MSPLVLWFTPGYRVPTPAQIERLCRTEPGVKPRPWTHIILHHSAGDAGDAASIDHFHRQGRGWVRGLGYDFVIGNGTGSGDGEIEVSDRWRRQLDGAHCKADNMNARAIGICFVGNFQEHRGPSDAQIHAGLALVRFLARKFSIAPDRILGHGQVAGASTECPGRLFPIELLRAAAR